MKVIRFPGAALTPAVPVKKKEMPFHRLLLDSAAFTCSSCGHSSDITTRGMVFRTVEFYCNSCGTFYRLTNPAFGHFHKKK